MKRTFALLLAICLLLWGCVPQGPEELYEAMHRHEVSTGNTFSDLTYTRPDLDAFQATADKLCQAADHEDTDALLDLLWDYYDAYDEFYTMLNLADIRYSLDLTDKTYAQEYDWLTENSAQVDKSLDDVYRALGACPVAEELEAEYFGDGFFDSYRETEDSPWNDTFSALITQEANLQSQYYEKLEQLPEITDEGYSAKAAELLGPVLLELVEVRRQLAETAGYPDYESFAWDWYYGRDYTPEDAESYLQQVRQRLVPLYKRLWSSNFYWDTYTGRYDARDSQAYLSSAVEQMGGVIQEAWELMLQRELYDIEPSDTKYAGSFELYLTSFSVPFVFVNPQGDVTDLSTFAHEFGHFANDYAAEGSFLSADVSEILSQGMEYLAASYATAPEGKPEKVRKTLLADSLSTFVEQSAYYTFEKELYNLEELTLENVNALFAQVASDYGYQAVGFAREDWATVPHFYTQPFYVLGYVFSADAALQIYLLEQEEVGAGLALYEKLLSQWEDNGFVDFVETQGLESPFAQGHLERLTACFRDAF